MTRNERAREVAGLSTPADQFRELVSCNGTVQNMAVRRMTADQIDALGEYAATQPPDPVQHQEHHPTSGDEGQAGMTGKVIAGPAGHWYALMDGYLLGKPMRADEDKTQPPAHPTADADWADEWYEITDPAPETDTDALIAELSQ